MKVISNPCSEVGPLPPRNLPLHKLHTPYITPTSGDWKLPTAVPAHRPPRARKVYGEPRTNAQTQDPGWNSTVCVSDLQRWAADHPSPRACSSGPREHSPTTAARPARCRGAGLGAAALPPSSGTLGAQARLGCAWAPHLVGLGWGHQQTSDHGQHTQELHASRAFTGPARSHLEKKYAGGEGADEHWHPRPRSEPTGLLCSPARKRAGAGPGVLGLLSPAARRFPLARASVSHRPPGGLGGGAFWAEEGPRVSGTRLAGDPLPASPPPSSIAARGSSQGGGDPGALSSEPRSHDQAADPGPQGPQGPRRPAAPANPSQRAPGTCAPPRRHKTPGWPRPQSSIAGGDRSTLPGCLQGNMARLRRAPPRLRAREREAFLNPTKQEKGASAKRKSSGRGLASPCGSRVPPPRSSPQYLKAEVWKGSGLFSLAVL